MWDNQVVGISTGVVLHVLFLYTALSRYPGDLFVLLALSVLSVLFPWRFYQQNKPYYVPDGTDNPPIVLLWTPSTSTFLIFW
jgi:hypothetical protein